MLCQEMNQRALIIIVGSANKKENIIPNGFWNSTNIAFPIYTV